MGSRALSGVLEEILYQHPKERISVGLGDPGFPKQTLNLQTVAEEAGGSQ